MFDFISQYFWIVGLLFLLWCVPECERRAYGLADAGRLSVAEAARVTRFVWLSALGITVTTIVAQFTYAGPRGPCAVYADPLRPQALLAWVVVEVVLLRIGSFAVTRTDRAPPPRRRRFASTQRESDDQLIAALAYARGVLVMPRTFVLVGG